MIFNVPGHIDMIRIGTKTQTRRLNRGIYQVGRDYAVQSKRGVKAESAIRIVIDEICEEEGHLAMPNMKWLSKKHTQSGTVREDGLLNST
jgi:hypothetical protein